MFGRIAISTISAVLIGVMLFAIGWSVLWSVAGGAVVGGVAIATLR